MEPITLTAQEIYDLFAHRTDVYSLQQSSGAYYPIRKTITLEVIEKHLRGEHTIGVYCLGKDNTIKWACIDLDGDGSLSELRQLSDDSNKIYDAFKDFKRMKEFSGRKGFHIWVFFKKPVNAGYGQRLIKARLNSLSLKEKSTKYLSHEVFPKQTSLLNEKSVGNLVKVVQAIHKVNGKRSQVLRMDEAQK